MKRRLEGRHAVLTGAGRGLGRALALSLAKQGASLTVCARTESELDRTVEQIRAAGGRVTAHRTDLGDPRACEELIAAVLSDVGGVDTLINNAGTLELAPIEDLSLQQWAGTLAVNLTAPYLLTRGFLPVMKRRGGSIINVSSRAGVTGFKEEAAYCASKFGLEGLTRALARELAGTSVSINTVTPGLKIKPTSMTDEAFHELSDEQRGAWSEPDAICPAFVLLAGLRGAVSGLRFDAYVLSGAIRREGFDLRPERIKELAE